MRSVMKSGVALAAVASLALVTGCSISLPISKKPAPSQTTSATTTPSLTAKPSSPSATQSNVVVKQRNLQGTPAFTFSDKAGFQYAVQGTAPTVELMSTSIRPSDKPGMVRLMPAVFTIEMVLENKSGKDAPGPTVMSLQVYTKGKSLDECRSDGSPSQKASIQLPNGQVWCNVTSNTLGRSGTVYTTFPDKSQLSSILDSTDVWFGMEVPEADAGGLLEKSYQQEVAFLWTEADFTSGQKTYTSPTTRAVKVKFKKPDGTKGETTMQVFSASPNITLG